MADLFVTNTLIEGKFGQEVTLKPFGSIEIALRRLETLAENKPTVHLRLILRDGTVLRWENGKAVECPDETELVTNLSNIFARDRAA
jgi:hypothetical protein